MSERLPLTAIVGCGPSGLLAAHACFMRGVPFAIFSKKVVSRLGGAQFSHIPIPGIHDPDDPEVKIKFEVVGDDEVYRDKVYGDMKVPFVSMTNVGDGHLVPAWNLRKMYSVLWERYEAKIIDVPLDAIGLDKLTKTFDLVYSSVPRPATCWGSIAEGVNHTFQSVNITIVNEALDPSLEDNTIRYDGTKDHGYYRMSKIFGVGSTEYGSSSPVPPVDEGKVVSVRKPISSTCGCHPHVRFVGRFGTWKKGVLTFHAFNQVLDDLTEMGIW